MADISQLTQIVLSGMLAIIPPGKTIYSRTTVENCDAQCQATPVCTDPSLLCSPPKFSQEIFDSKLDLSKKEALSPEAWEAYQEKTKNASFTRAETYQEGLQRYAVIAQAIAETSQELNWGKIGPKCKAECNNSPFSSKCRECKSSRPWTGSERDLTTALVTIFNYEGGFRQDVQSGVGPLAKGDCKWVDVKTQKQARPNAKGATPLKNTCRSVCLAQINIGPDTKFGYKMADLIGTSLEATSRCAEVAGRMLSQARSRCSGPNVDYTGDWVAGMFAAYGTGGACNPSQGTGGGMKKALWPGQRAKTFRTIQALPTALSEEVKQALGLANEGPLALGD